MNEQVQQLEFRLGDTRAAGTRTQSSQEAKRAVTELEAALKVDDHRAIAGDPTVSVSRWKDNGTVNNLLLQVAIRTDRIDVARATEIMATTVRRLQEGAFRA
ncbi:hypothetical protein [Aquisalimonas sp.]|uniref:hypothetical protein n=1 Tax=Aquisalimonas sp. TaxID=1872621 RepID=UPI0025C5199F|nr:hypothetical protein [Aquisalimonas sp.]